MQAVLRRQKAMTQLKQLIVTRVNLTILAWYATLLFFAAFSLLPVLWMLATSVKPQANIFTFPPPIIFRPTLDHWSAVLRSAEFRTFYRNSLIISTLSTLLVMVLATPAGYSLARYAIPRKEDLTFWILSQGMMPPIAVIIPLYVLMSNLRLIDTYPGIIAVYSGFNLPFAIWLLRGFFADLPIELEESALVDGANRLEAFLRIALPLTRPGLISCTVYTFVMCINEFFLAFVLTGTRVRPASVAIMQFLPTGVRGTLFGEAATAAILIMTPAVVCFIFLQRYLVAGLTLGAVKQ